MKLRKRLLKKSRLYLILDRPRFSLSNIRNLFCGKEIGLIQLRDKISTKSQVLKNAVKLAGQIGLTKTLFIVNDYPDVAQKASADGVHLGQDDLSVKQAREILGPDKIIGVSCHSLAQALQAQKEGADYLGIGPIYPTATKPGCPAIGLKTAARLKAKVKIPYFAIGNIHEGNIQTVTAAGIKRVAVCRAILETDDPVQAAKRLYKKLRKNDPVRVR
ncbi:MAG: thiamine phosphate synthase [Candidatus Omnitrophica bacterium CG11_big_fil_rev_8_21_14_0_20_43_6]|nr:MAG: thiamine phosphate synthase [Candidatus Omnitrophica bacterium CG11_big_fil_rev_8_21_14_0_20_43_6]